jgi:orotidine-5'-phosphate decarboxylase
MLEAISTNRKSKIILALDLDYREDTSSLLGDAKKILNGVSDYVCAVKINHHLLLPLSLSEISSLNNLITRKGLVAIADLKLNDIDNTNRVATNYLWDSGFSAVIVNPFVGYTGALDVVFEHAHRFGKGVITLAYMSHKGADEGFGLKLAHNGTIFDEFLLRAASWGSDGVIVGSTRPERIAAARSSLGNNVPIICPGSITQGGDSLESLKSGADYLIFGRSIVDSPDPTSSARLIYQSLALKAKNLPRAERSSHSRK